MEKNTYETYEYLPSNSTDAESDQFFVVQDDGTFLLNRQVQYVAQVQDVKEVLEEVQPCTVYGVGVSAQQFYVDNSAELISVSDQFILPTGDNNIYTNSFLLQPASNSTTEQIEEDVGDHLKESITDDATLAVTAATNSQNSNFTEITLSDEQYQTLEHKGWILLESNNKTYVLNTLGLHDITTNDKLIQKLRNEIQNDVDESGLGNIKIQSVKQEVSSLVAQPLTNEDETVVIINNNEEEHNNIDNIQFIINDKEDINELNTLENQTHMEICDSNQTHVEICDSNQTHVEICDSNQTHMEICDSNQEQNTRPHLINKIETVKQEPLVDRSSVKIKTKFNFKDIPDKIVLGRTVNGKRLVANVVKTITHNEREEESENKGPVVENEQNNQNSGISETELITLIQHSIRTGAQKIIKPEEIKSTKNVIAPLLKVPNLKNSLVGHNLVITKVRSYKHENGLIHRGKVILLTGQVVNKDDSTAVFEFLPDLLLNIRKSSEESMANESHQLECIDNEKETCMIIHVHITETRGADKVIRVSVTLTKRQLSINQMFDIKKRRNPNTVFACSACATLFKSESALKEHQENDCLDTDEGLTIDIDKVDMVDAYSIIKPEKDKSYSCTQCNAKFTKLYNCVKHVKTHFGLNQSKAATNIEKESSNEEQDDKTQNRNKKKVYKCKMCSGTYFHPATLSKHIVTRHIKIKSK